MKKSLLLSLAAASMLAACNSNEDLGNVNDSELAKQKIELGVSTNATVKTRGTGTVGGVEVDENKWDGQYLWVSMLEKGTMKPTQYVDPNGVGTVIYEDKLFKAPTTADNAGEKVQSGLAYADDNSVAYYPVSGNSDFWGYRIDNAAGVATQTPTVKLYNGETETDNVEEATRRVVDFTIDGTQDIMTGKAKLADGEEDKLGARTDDYYSAYASRHGVQPNITFDHQLTRFTFVVKAGSKSTAGNGDNTEAVSVTGLKLGSYTNGQLTVAYTGEAPESLISFDKSGDMTMLELKERANADQQNVELQPLTAKDLEWDDAENKAVELPIGEALLVSPSEVSYPLTINLEQPVVKSDDRNGNKVFETLELQQNVQLPEVVGGYLAGHSYVVTITVYGLEKIEVTATLNPWVNGGNITIDEDAENIFTPATQD